MPQYTFIGFSTVDRETPTSWTLRNKELIKRDILNEIYTRKGERVMLPDYGSIVWQLLMEPWPLSDGLKDAVVTDLTRIVTKDQRVTLVPRTDGAPPVYLTEIESGFRVEITIQYKPDKSVESFVADFDRSQGTGFGQ